MSILLILPRYSVPGCFVVRKSRDNPAQEFQNLSTVCILGFPNRDRRQDGDTSHSSTPHLFFAHFCIRCVLNAVFFSFHLTVLISIA